MASVKQQENMLLTEHFTWSPISLIDDIINAANEVLYKCTDTFESGLLAADPSILGFTSPQNVSAGESEDEWLDRLDKERRLEVEEGVLKLETLMENALDRNLDRLEIWTLRNVLCLPGDVAGWVRLGHYENLTLPSPQTTNTITPESLHALRRKLLETQKLHTALIAEKTRNEANIQNLRSLLQPSPHKSEPRTSTSSTFENTNPTATEEQTSSEPPFAFLTHTPAAQNLGIQSLPQPTNTTSASTSTTLPAPQNASPLKTHTTFTTSQLPHLRALLAGLKPHLATAALPPTSSNASSKDDLAKERKTYIESQSKRVLERRGVDTRDGVEGEAQVGSGRVRGDEIRGLEGIVSGFRRRADEGKVGEGEGDGGEEMDTS